MTIYPFKYLLFYDKSQPTNDVFSAPIHVISVIYRKNIRFLMAFFGLFAREDLRLYLQIGGRFGLT
jgi:hypothetical protein